MKRFILPLAIFCALGLAHLPAAEKAPAIHWEKWSDDLFARAKAEHRFVLLDLGAVWCHWCHVMDEITYADPVVIALINNDYIAVRVDQDSRPDLANRYEDYGWPATIVFNIDGSEIVKRRGYIPPKPMASMLQAIIDDPSPGPSVEPEPVIVPTAEGTLSEQPRGELRTAFLDAYDQERGGWGDVHKYLNWDALEYCLVEGAAGDAAMAARAKQTLTSGLKLIDPVWGGVYQYSTDGDWDHPHFEKIMPFQAENLRIFSLAATLTGDPQWLKPAQQIRAYLRDFLRSPEGAFYVSQDADLKPGEHSGEYFALDDAGRRAQGIPRIDRHIYARENGLAITGLAALYATTGDAEVLAEARRAADWIIAHRSLAEGGFRHDETDAGGPYLSDTLAMGRAFLALYTVTAERRWLQRAEAAAGFIEKQFRGSLGYATAASAAAGLPAKPQLDENLTLTRWAHLLQHHTGDDRWKAMAQHAFRYASAPAVLDQLGFGTSGVLLTDRELRQDPAHLTIVGRKDDPAATALFSAALKGAPPAARIEWYDPAEGALPRRDVEYPVLKVPAAFVCADGRCSLPLRSAEELTLKLANRGH